MTTSPAYDDKLWFTTDSHCSHLHYLIGNCDTFRGRMLAWRPHQRVGFCVSKSQIATCSIETHYWVQGFLIGNQPPRPCNEDGDLLPPDNPVYRVWEEAVTLFVETGVWVEMERHCEQCSAQLLPSQPGLRCSACQTNTIS